MTRVTRAVVAQIIFTALVFTDGALDIFARSSSSVTYRHSGTCSEKCLHFTTFGAVCFVGKLCRDASVTRATAGHRKVRRTFYVLVHVITGVTPQ